jgi:uncharacterized membrane protein
MSKYPITFGAIALSMLALDVVWIGWLAKPLYQSGIGHLMSPSPRLDAALLFYALYACGLLLFVVSADQSGAAWTSTALRGALFGLVAYGTYDLSNLATLRDWPLTVTAVDMAWGAFASSAGALAGRAAWNHTGS